MSDPILSKIAIDYRPKEGQAAAAREAIEGAIDTLTMDVLPELCEDVELRVTYVVGES